jgi:hypothetical protein
MRCDSQGAEVRELTSLNVRRPGSVRKCLHRGSPVGGSAATGPVGTECRSGGVAECRSAGVPEYGGAGLVLLPGSGCLPGTAGRPVSNSLTYRVCRCWCRGIPLSAAAAQRARWYRVTECRSAGVRGCRACAAVWFGVPVGNGRPSCAQFTDLQSLSLLVSRDPAVGGSGATGPVVQSYGVAELQSTGVPE